MPSDAPPFEEKRKDINTRAVIDVLKKHFDIELTKQDERLEDRLTEKLKSVVTWQGLAASIVGLVGMVFLVVSAFMTPVKESQNQARADVKEIKSETADSLKEMRQEIRQISAEVRAVRSVTVDGKTRGQAKEELRKENAEEKP